MLENNKFRQFWDFFQFILIVYTATYMPFKIAFVNDDTTLGDIWTNFMDVFFICDIFVVFISAYPDPVTF